MHETKVSVIVPVYNGERFIEKCLESVLNQTYPASEIIVVNDGSTDSSFEIIESMPDITCINTENKGVAAARNTGIDHCKGDWISFIDQDDLWTANSMESKVTMTHQNPNTSLVIGKQKWFLDGLNSIPSWVKQEQMETELDGYLLGCSLIKKNLFETYGQFDSSFRFCSDFDWFFRLKDDGIEFKQVNDIVLMKRIHAENESRHAEESLKELSRAIFNSIKRKRKN
ncbi:glycosyltransferase family 2 protein [Ekhidna sp. To15]|uniref:glycosyltransferase family 2 protein n=1 Tax=Ekhidna sp. To15 TaxID=3395267 RepID=UPI003F51FA03